MSETTTIEYEVSYQLGRNANVEGAPYETLDEAIEAFEAECSQTDPDRSKTVWLNRVRCTYDGDECVDVEQLETVRTATF